MHLQRAMWFSISCFDPCSLCILKQYRISEQVVIRKYANYFYTIPFSIFHTYMNSLKPIGKLFYGIGIAGIGLLHFMYAGFRPVILPVPAEATKNISFLVYVTGAILVLAGLAIAFLQKIKNIAFFFGIFLLLFVIIGHLPNRFMNHPEILGMWTDTLKLLALAGGAFIVSSGNLSNYGKYFFALMLVIFGIDHFVYTDFVKLLVPAWIPGPLFWTYVAGIALIGSGVALFINFKPKTISFLLGIMLLIWLVILHIPRAFAAPATDNGNEWTSVFQCLAFSGMAFLLSARSSSPSLVNSAT